MCSWQRMGGKGEDGSAKQVGHSHLYIKCFEGVPTLSIVARRLGQHRHSWRAGHHLDLSRRAGELGQRGGELRYLHCSNTSRGKQNHSSVPTARNVRRMFLTACSWHGKPYRGCGASMGSPTLTAISLRLLRWKGMHMASMCAIFVMSAVLHPAMPVVQGPSSCAPLWPATRLERSRLNTGSYPRFPGSTLPGLDGI